MVHVQDNPQDVYKSATEINRKVMEALANDAINRAVEKGMLESPLYLARDIVKVLKKMTLIKAYLNVYDHLTNDGEEVLARVILRVLRGKRHEQCKNR